MSIIGRGGVGPGPVFLYEWIIASRRWQGYALRSLFVLGLLAALVAMARGQGRGGGPVAPPGLRALAKLGENLFVAVIGTQLTLVLLAAPAATAGAICLDRSRGTLTHLLVTDLTDREIVLGKLAARLVPIVTLVAATLPFLELLGLLGGVDSDALLGAFLVTLGVAVLGCCLALVFSIWVRKTHEALLATYAVWGLWLLGPPMLDQLSRATGLSLSVPLRTAEPYTLAFAPYWQPGSVGWQDYLVFLASTLAVSAVLALLAVRTMRRAGTRDVVQGAVRRRRRWLPAIEPPRILASRLRGWSRPVLDFNPVLWREWHRSRPPRWGRIVATAFVVLAVTFSAIAIQTGQNGILPPWLNAFQVAIGLLFLSVIASTSLAEERVRGSLDVLMTTPLATWQIVIGKWLGTYRLVPPLVILPVAVVLGIGSPDGREWPIAYRMILFVLSSGAAITSLGLAMATWCPRLGRAVGLTVTLYLLVTVGWMFMVIAIRNGFDERSLMMGSPWFWSGMMTATLRHGEPDHQDVWDWGYLWTVIYALTALTLLAATLATFNRCLGRVEPRLFPPGPREMRSEGQARTKRAKR
jgi:ABC-type transport system involved in multi-copper enzyme maturation permease subunit